tara:strand:- start:15235 stop:16005 length:771 start_codon:yes stop_codon:yes gene_type:complete
MQNSLIVSGIKGLPELKPGDDLAKLIQESMNKQDLEFQCKDILVVTQKIVSKIEGRTVDLRTIIPSERAKKFAIEWDKDARVTELVLRESVRVLRMQYGIIISENKNGFVCANAGIDASNVGRKGDNHVVLLPVDCDKSSAMIRARIKELTGVEVAVIISDTFGRPWREGAINVAVGASGIAPLMDYRGLDDNDGREMHSTTIAIVDELASAGELVMNKIDRIPVALIRGYAYETSNENEIGIRALIRDSQKDLFP